MLQRTNAHNGNNSPEQGTVDPAMSYKTLIDDARGTLDDLSRQAASLQREAISSSGAWRQLEHLRTDIERSTIDLNKLLNPSTQERKFSEDLEQLEVDEQEYWILVDTLTLEIERAQKDIEELQLQDACSLEYLHKCLQNLETENAGFRELLGLDILTCAEPETVEIRFHQHSLSIVFKLTSSGAHIVSSTLDSGDQSESDEILKALQQYITNFKDSTDGNSPDLTLLVLLAHSLATTLRASER